MKRSLVRFILIPLAVSLVVLSVIYAGALHYLDRQAQDSLYQANGIPSKDIVIIGIDNNTLNVLGPYGPNYRAIMAMALDELAADPENKPAVTAIDILYEGEIGQPSSVLWIPILP